MAVPVRVAPATVAASWADIVPLPPLLAPELADIYSGYARESDPRQWFFSQPQQPPLGFVGLRRQSGTFPGGKYAKIRAYRYGGDGSYPSPSRLDPYTPGCGGGMVASDGTLCPSVQYPGWDVTAERAELLFGAYCVTPRFTERRVVRQRPEAPPVARGSPQKQLALSSPPARVDNILTRDDLLADLP